MGECPTWDPATRSLYWTDILDRSLHWLNPNGGEHRIELRGMLISGLLPASGGGLWLLGDLGRVSRLSGGTVRALRRLSPRWIGYRFNDCIADSRGRVLAGVMGHQRDLSRWPILPGLRRRLQQRRLWWVPTRRAGSLCRLDSAGKALVVMPDLQRPNGLAFSPEGTRLYVTDSRRACILACDYDVETGAVGPPAMLVDARHDPGVPDGLVTDESGCLWSARHRGGEVVRHDPQGRVVERIPVPVDGVTSLCFGGTHLYLTSAGGNGRDSGVAGGVFRYDAGIRGSAVHCARLADAGSGT